MTQSQTGTRERTSDERVEDGTTRALYEECLEEAFKDGDVDEVDQIWRTLWG